MGTLATGPYRRRIIRAMCTYVLGQWGVERQIEVDWLTAGFTEKNSCPITKRIICLKV
jgi:hypothetical protein